MTIHELRSPQLSVSVLAETGMPEIVAVGPADLGPVPASAVRQPVVNSTVDNRQPQSIVAEESSGFDGRAGIIGSRVDGTAWSPRFELVELERTGDAELTARLRDDIAALELELHLVVDDAVRLQAMLTNRGDSNYRVDRLAMSVPIPPWCTDMASFSGRWAHEFGVVRQTFDHPVSIENRSGRTSHRTAPAMFVGTDGFDEHHGEVFGIQLAWSGNYQLTTERLLSGLRTVSAGELLAPGEIELSPGATYTTPEMFVVYSSQGLTPASQAFHRVTRSRLRIERARPVTLNTWEAVYFDHDLATLTDLATTAASIGIERFVLDDGWFGGRRDDTAGLGDWHVSADMWPDGLGPLIDTVTGLGMEFGLWVEPEMVNPDSDLYRAHPEWTLDTEGYEPMTGRHQLVLDLGRPEVREHLFDQLDALLSAYDISALKWDMNRTLAQASDAAGRAGTHGFVVGTYELIDRLRAAHPHVDIESCSSGGARADLGILSRTDRVWTSDCNDALERQHIQRGFSMLFPPEVMGAHVGPPVAHTTGRHQRIGFRAATALFGHMGVEWNILDADEHELSVLTAAIDFHRRHRNLLHHGDVIRIDTGDQTSLAHGVIAADRERALIAFVQLDPPRTGLSTRFRVPGLDVEARYRVRAVDELATYAVARAAAGSWCDEPVDMSGRQLASVGLQPPTLHPESVLIIDIQRIDFLEEQHG